MNKKLFETKIFSISLPHHVASRQGHEGGGSVETSKTAKMCLFYLSISLCVKVNITWISRQFEFMNKIVFTFLLLGSSLTIWICTETEQEDTWMDSINLCRKEWGQDIWNQFSLLNHFPPGKPYKQVRWTWTWHCTLDSCRQFWQFGRQLHQQFTFI